MKLNLKQQMKIYAYYLEDDVVDKGAVRSVLPGRNDNRPSFVVFRSSYAENKILWKDYAKPCEGTDAIALICEMENMARNEAYDFFEQVIDKEVSDNIEYKPRRKLEPRLDLKPYEAFELEYWGKRYVDKKTLLTENIRAVMSLCYDEYCVGKSIPKSPMFAYLFDQDRTSWKTYRPFETDNDKKWKTYNISEVIEGMNTLPKNYESLIIASSTKDRLAWKKAHPAVINPTGEGNLRNIIRNFYDLSLRFQNIYCIFDADEAGWNNAQKLASMTGGKVIAINANEFTPFWLKDIDDITVRYGPDAPSRILKTLNII